MRGRQGVRPGHLWEAWQTRRASAAGSAVYPSFARLGASRPPQSVQVETHLSQVGGASLSRSGGRANGTQNPVGCHAWRENEGGSKLFRRRITPALTLLL